MRRITLSCILATLFFIFSSGVANAQNKIPGEGSEIFRIAGGEYDAGSYDIVVNMNVTMKYRFSTLLGDHVEKFTPKYDVTSAFIYKRNTKELIFSASLDSFYGDIVAYSGGTGNPHFTVGPEVMKKLTMTSMVFQLNPCDIDERNAYLIKRTFPGYLRGSGEWGWDLPGSFQWDKILENTNSRKVGKDEAKRYWTKMTLTYQPTCGGRLIDGRFYISNLMAAITAQIPDAFSKSKGVSPAFAQMSALNAQLREAKSEKSDGWQKREKLTQRAWAVLKNDMTAGERRLLAEAALKIPTNAKAINELDLLFSTAEREIGQGNKQLSAATKNQLQRAVSIYMPAKLTALKLPMSIRTRLLKLAGYQAEEKKKKKKKKIIPKKVSKKTYYYIYQCIMTNDKRRTPDGRYLIDFNKYSNIIRSSSSTTRGLYENAVLWAKNKLKSPNDGPFDYNDQSVLCVVHGSKSPSNDLEPLLKQVRLNIRNHTAGGGQYAIVPGVINEESWHNGAYEEIPLAPYIP